MKTLPLFPHPTTPLDAARRAYHEHRDACDRGAACETCRELDRRLGEEASADVPWPATCKES
jgi:hypothetical protein